MTESRLGPFSELRGKGGIAYMAVGVVDLSHDKFVSVSGKLKYESSFDNATSPRIAMPCLSHLYALESRVETTTVRNISGMK